MTDSVVAIVDNVALAKLERVLKISRENQEDCSHRQALEHMFSQVLPMTCRLLPEALKQQLITAYLDFCAKASDGCAFPRGLALFVQDNQWNKKTGIPYLHELMDLECLKIEVYLLPEQPIKSYYPHGDLMQDVLVFNPDYRLKAYQYPVFQPAFLQGHLKAGPQAGHYDLLCFRSPKTKEVHLISLTPFHRKVIELISEQEVTGKQAIQKAAAVHSTPLTAQLYEEGRQFFQSLLSQDAILGFQE